MDNFRRYTTEAFFLPVGSESAFCIFYAPTTPQRDGVLYIHPFAEEMHKSRRMASITAQHLATAGHPVLQMDLIGCGDSSGEFEDADGAKWQACLEAGYDWLVQTTRAKPIFWGLRLGASLAVQLCARLPAVSGLILWQPVTNGEKFLAQYLRTKIASEMFSRSSEKMTVLDLRNGIERNGVIEVGGYALNKRLVKDIENIDFERLRIGVPVYWMEIHQAPRGGLSTAAQHITRLWSKHGTQVFPVEIIGNPFWTSQEILECENLLAATLVAAHSLCS